MSLAISKKMTSPMVSAQSWAEVVKGKENIACGTVQKKKKKFNAAAAEFVPRKKNDSAHRAEDKLNLNAEAPDFSVPELKMNTLAKDKFNLNAEAPEFSVPEVKMNALAKEFVPPATQGLNAESHAFSVPELKMNALAKEFIPPQHKLLRKAADMQKLLLECYTDDDSSDDEPAIHVAQRRQQVKSSGPVLPFRPPPGLAPPGKALNPFAEAFDGFPGAKITSAAPACMSAINLSGFYSEDDDDESLVSTPREPSKMDQISVQDSTSAGESSDSETESWSGPHSP